MIRKQERFMSVLKLRPDFKEYIWGGTRLREEFGKKCDLERIAESWELACRKDGNCRIEQGELEGKTLWEYIQAKGKDVLGTSCEGSEDFPLLIKLIDAENDLSVQVHPDDEYAMRVHGEAGKTEMWYVVDCKQDASLICGFKQSISKDEFAQSINDGTLLEKVNTVPVKKGDVFFIPSGTLHAIGKGILIAEIQQNSNTTYRVYDYGRVGADGKPRELHVDRAIDVTDTVPYDLTEQAESVKADGFSYRLLARCGYFTVVKFDVESSVEINIDNRSFAHLLMLEGSAKISSDCELSGEKGDSFFIDAASGKVHISGKCSFILTRNGCEEGVDRIVEK